MENTQMKQLKNNPSTWS